MKFLGVGLMLLFVFSKKTYSQDTPFAIKTNIAYFFQGIPISAEVNIGKKQSIVSDVSFTLLNDYKDNFFMNGSIHHRVTLGFRQYFTSKNALNIKKMEGLYLQPTLFYSKNTKYKKDAFSIGLSFGAQLRSKKTFLVDLGLGVGIIKDNQSKVEGFFEQSTKMLHPKVGIGWVIK